MEFKEMKPPDSMPQVCMKTKYISHRGRGKTTASRSENLNEIVSKTSNSRSSTILSKVDMLSIFVSARSISIILLVTFEIF